MELSLPEATAAVAGIAGPLCAAIGVLYRRNQELAAELNSKLLALAEERRKDQVAAGAALANLSQPLIDLTGQLADALQDMKGKK